MPRRPFKVRSRAVLRAISLKAAQTSTGAFAVRWRRPRHGWRRPACQLQTLLYFRRDVEEEARAVARLAREPIQLPLVERIGIPRTAPENCKGATKTFTTCGDGPQKVPKPIVSAPPHFPAIYFCLSAEVSPTSLMANSAGERSVRRCSKNQARGKLRFKAAYRADYDSVFALVCTISSRRDDHLECDFSLPRRIDNARKSIKRPHAFFN